ncbi:hypothetical protein WMF27_32500 [Sorangium sp. So ce281]|uniref:hypothetical protein n=1 Tax=unclassified Sorangium TaxID=2621164 RepID=UPI003F60FAEC
MGDSPVPLAIILIGVVGIVVAQVIATRQVGNQRNTFQARVEQDVHLRLQEALELLSRQDEAQAQAALMKARMDYEAVRSSSIVSLELDVPEPSVIPTTEAKLLAGGKVTYKEKGEKQLREQYLRLVGGLAIRHASEALLNLPTCQLVELCAFRTALDPSIGRPTRCRVLYVRVDYPTLAPMTMDGIDPLLTMKHFNHKINVDRGRNLQPLDTSISGGNSG